MVIWFIIMQFFSSGFIIMQLFTIMQFFSSDFIIMQVFIIMQFSGSDFIIMQVFIIMRAVFQFRLCNNAVVYNNAVFHPIDLLTSIFKELGELL